MNALAGGGSFVTLPALMAIGLPSVSANACSTIALFPGGLVSAWTYRRDLPQTIATTPIGTIALLTLAGGAMGAGLLLVTPARLFSGLLPWLLLLACLGLTLGPRLIRRTPVAHPRHPALLLTLQGILGLYGGYFGGAVGLMMLAVWSLLGEHDIKRLNAPRTLLVSIANGVAVVLFALSPLASWPEIASLLAGGLLGGHLGAKLGRVLPTRFARPLTLAVTSGVTALYFWKTYA